MASLAPDLMKRLRSVSGPIVMGSKGEGLVVMVTLLMAG
jgi:hypothetical protein